jgi:prepilin peptidase CpaA
MHSSVLTALLLAALAVGLVIAAYTDIRRRQIDNWLTGGIVLLAPVFWWASGASWGAVGWHLGVALLSFAVLALLFALRAMGGGDVKLLTALALWIRPEWFAQLVLIMAILGGVLTVGLALWHFTRRQREKLAIPYGIAISGAGLWILSANYYPLIQAGGHVGL